MTNSELEVLKVRLANLAGLEETDYDQILKISNEIAKYDTEKVRFSVDADHVNRLGRELVGRQETAVSELVKNAFDADATRVELTFIDAINIGGTLVIKDDGNGMTRGELINGFMRLSSREKSVEPISPKFKRLRAGRKGIGRFATQRLGEKLTVKTKSNTSANGLQIKINWNDFKASKDLGQITNVLEEIEYKENHGTVLIIENLGEEWSDQSLRRIYRYIADLLQPFPLSKSEHQSENDPGFDVSISRIDKGKKLEVASVDKLVYEFAVAKIEALVDENKLGYWSIESENLQINDTAEPMSASDKIDGKSFKHLKEVYLEAYYYIHTEIPRNQRKVIRDLLLERGGIRIYRNGFRVLPYGEQYNDWLKLLESTSRRLILPPHANYNYFGFVEITDLDGKTFDETASREGLIENNAFNELADFVARVLRSAALRVAAARGRKRTAGEKEWENKNPAEALEESAEKLEGLAEFIESTSNENIPLNTNSNDLNNAPDKLDLVDSLRDTAQVIRESSEAQKQIELQLADKVTLMRVLASLGQAVGEFTHEIRHLIPSMSADVKFFGDHAPTTEEWAARVESLQLNILNFRTLANFFDKAASENSRREMEIQDLGKTARIFHSSFSESSKKRYGITFHPPKINGIDLFTIQMHPSELQSVLLNFFTNARKAIGKRGEDKGNIQISVGKIDRKTVYIEFSDDGTGIDPDHLERIFDPFFSTSIPKELEAKGIDEISSSGLGLSIVKEIVAGYQGNVDVVNSPIGYKTTFRIELPAASNEEIEQYGY